MDNPEKLATQSTQDKYMLETTEGAIKNGQSRETGKHRVHKINICQRQPKGQSKMDNPEKLANIGYTRQINVRDNRRGNQKWTIQRNWQINDREY